MELSRILEETEHKMSSAMTSVSESLKSKSSPATRRRQFQQRRTKSAMDIATDYLIQSRSQESPKGSPSSTRSWSHTDSKGKTGYQDGAPSPSPSSSPYVQRSAAGDVTRRTALESVDEDQGTPVSSCTNINTDYSQSTYSSMSLSSSSKSSSRERERREGAEIEEESSKSWRRVMFERVCTTMARQSTLIYTPVEVEMDIGTGRKNDRRRKSIEVRTRWKKATLETLLHLKLNKNESDNTEEDKKENNGDQRLGYENLSPCPQDLVDDWQRLLETASTTSTTSNISNASSASNSSQPSSHYRALYSRVRRGVPREMRGMVWKLLALHQSNAGEGQRGLSGMFEVPYTDLLDRFTPDQHAILIDLGRTFPGHPHFSKSLGAGQLELFNVLKAYSLLDQEIGYCQGVSFIAGILIMHMEEAAAFEMLRHLMLGLGLRSQYSPCMTSLQLKLYQFVRLLYDNDLEVFQQLERHEAGPALYATPWFLTLFASQYPVSFVSRVFDLLFLQGTDVIFKVALLLMTCHRELILQCDCFEDLVDFLKTGLPDMAHVQTERVTDQAFDMDVARQLHTYELEFHIFREEMLCSSNPTTTSATATTTPSATITHRDNKTQTTIQNLQHKVFRLEQEKKELREQLERAHSQLHSLNMAADHFRLNEDKFKSAVRSLELERSALLATVSQLKGSLSGREGEGEGDKDKAKENLN